MLVVSIIDRTRIINMKYLELSCVGEIKSQFV